MCFLVIWPSLYVPLFLTYVLLLLFTQVREKYDLFRSKFEKIKQDIIFTDNLWDSKKGGDVFYRR